MANSRVYDLRPGRSTTRSQLGAARPSPRCWMFAAARWTSLSSRTRPRTRTSRSRRGGSVFKVVEGVFDDHVRFRFRGGPFLARRSWARTTRHGLPRAAHARRRCLRVKLGQIWSKCSFEILENLYVLGVSKYESSKTRRLLRRRRKKHATASRTARATPATSASVLNPQDDTEALGAGRDRGGTDGADVKALCGNRTDRRVGPQHATRRRRPAPGPPGWACATVVIRTRRRTRPGRGR